MKLAVHRPTRRLRKGFLLMEVLLAFLVFGVAATGFAIALNRTADLATAAQRKLKMTRLLESALAEAMSYPVLEEGSTSVAVDEMSDEGLEITTIVELPNEALLACTGPLDGPLLQWDGTAWSPTGNVLRGT